MIKVSYVNHEQLACILEDRKTCVCSDEGPSPSMFVANTVKVSRVARGQTDVEISK